VHLHHAVYSIMEKCIVVLEILGNVWYLCGMCKMELYGGMQFVTLVGCLRVRVCVCVCVCVRACAWDMFAD